MCWPNYPMLEREHDVDRLATAADTGFAGTGRSLCIERRGHGDNVSKKQQHWEPNADTTRSARRIASVVGYK